MSGNPVLLIERRSEFGKGTARRARRAGKVPTVLYGHGAGSRHLDVPDHDLFLTACGTRNVFVELEIEGKTRLALVKDVQVHPVRRHILRADFLAVKTDEKVDVEAPVVVAGEPAPDTVHSIEEFTTLVKAPATSIPEGLEVSIKGVKAGSVAHVSDLLPPAGIEVELDPKTVIVAVQEAALKEAEETTEEIAAEGDVKGGVERRSRNARFPRGGEADASSPRRIYDTWGYE